MNIKLNVMYMMSCTERESLNDFEIQIGKPDHTAAQRLLAFYQTRSHTLSYFQ